MININIILGEYRASHRKRTATFWSLFHDHDKQIPVDVRWSPPGGGLEENASKRAGLGSR